MSNTINAGEYYDPYFYANQLIAQLYKALGLARAVYRGFDKEPARKGSTVKIGKPQSFVAQNMPIASNTALDPDEVDVVVDQWKGVRFGLTDKELTFTQQKIIDDHISPAAYAIADAIDQSIAAKISEIPWYYEAASTAAIADITRSRKVLNGNYVPKGQRFLAINDEREAGYLELGTFHEADKSSEGDRVQREGDLGRKFGFDIFNNQNIPDHIAGALSPGTQLQLNADVSAGDTTMVFKDSGGVLTGTVKAGDTFVVAGSTQRYAITADATAAGNLITVSVAPKCAEALSASANVTLRQADKSLNLGSHRDAIALAMAPLSMLGRDLAGARMATVSDPVTGLSVRSRFWYSGDDAEVTVALDALWGVKVLDHNKAMRLESPSS